MKQKRRLTQKCADRVLKRLREMVGRPNLGAAQCINRLRDDEYPSADRWTSSTINRWVTREGGVNEVVLLDFMEQIGEPLDLQSDLEDVPGQESSRPHVTESPLEESSQVDTEEPGRRAFLRRFPLPLIVVALALVTGFVGIFVRNMLRASDDVEWIQGRQRNLKTSLTIVASGGWKISTFASGFSTKGDPSGSPMGLAITDSGNVLVSVVNGKVLAFRADIDGQLADEAPVAFNYGGWNAMGMSRIGKQFYLAQLAAGRVVEMSEGGAFVGEVVRGLYGNLALAANPTNGHLYASSEYNTWITEIDPITKTKKVFATLPRGECGAGSLATDGVILYVQTFEDLQGPWGSGRVFGYRISDGEQVFDSGYLSGARGIAIGSGRLSGNIFVNGFMGQLVEINVKTKDQTVIANGGFGASYATVPNANGSLLLCQGDQILRLSPPDGDSFQSLSRISLDNGIVPGGSSSTGTVFLDAPASTRLTITLSSSSVIATVPDRVQIPAGAMHAAFPINTTPVSKSKSCVFTGTLNGTSEHISLKVRPPVVQSMLLSRQTITAGDGVTATVTLDVPAPQDGVIVTFLSGDTRAIPTPEQVTVRSGERVAIAQVRTAKIEGNTSVVVTASAGGGYHSERLLVESRK